MIAHPNVVDILDFGRTPAGPVFFVMEFLEGEDMSVLLRRLGRVPWPRVQPILLQIVRGLAAAHKCGVVHRDMKPANIFLVQRPDAIDQVKLLDFGIAKVADRDRPGNLTGEGSVFGTARYMSPEQAAGLPVDGRSDVYAVGILAYEMLSGRVPFDSDNFMRVATQHINDPIPPLRQIAPDVDPMVESLVMRALGKRPDARYASMVEFEAAILGASFESTVAIANPLGVDAADRTTIYDTRRSPRSVPPPVRAAEVDAVDATVVRPHTRHHTVAPPRGASSRSVPQAQVGSAPIFAPRPDPRSVRVAPMPPPIFDRDDRDDRDDEDFGHRGAPPSTSEFLSPLLPTGMAAPSSAPVEHHTLPPVNWHGGNPATLEPARRHEGAETHEFALNVPRHEVSRNWLVITVSVVALLMIWGGGAVWFFVLRDDSDAAPELHPTVAADEPRPSAVPAAPPQPAPEPAQPRPAPTPAPAPIADEPEPAPTRRDDRPVARPAPPRDALAAGDLDRGFGKARRAVVECGRTHGAVEGTSFAVTFDVAGARAQSVVVQRPWNATPLGLCVATAIGAKARFATARTPSTGVSRRVRF